MRRDGRICTLLALTQSTRLEISAVYIIQLNTKGEKPDPLYTLHPIMLSPAQ